MSSTKYSKTSWVPTVTDIAVLDFASSLDGFTVFDGGSYWALSRVASGGHDGGPFARFTRIGSSGSQTGAARVSFSFGSGQDWELSSYYRRGSLVGMGSAGIVPANISGFGSGTTTTSWVLASESRSKVVASGSYVIITAWPNAAVPVGTTYDFDSLTLTLSERDSWAFFQTTSSSNDLTLDSVGNSLYVTTDSAATEVYATRVLGGLTVGKAYQVNMASSRVTGSASGDGTTFAGYLLGATGTVSYTPLVGTTVATSSLQFVATQTNHTLTWMVKKNAAASLPDIYLRDITVSEFNVPNAPSVATRTNFPVASPALFDWTFSDPDSGDVQQSYQLIITRTSDSVVVKDTSKVSSSTSSYTLPASSLPNENIAYTWKVRTWDGDDYVGPYSAPSSFSTTFVDHNPTVTLSPVTMFDPAFSKQFSWTYSDVDSSDPQSSFRLVIKEGATTVYDTGTFVTASTFVGIPSGVLDYGTTYSYTVTVTDTRGPLTGSATGSFTTASFPNAPTLIDVEDISGTTDNDFSWSYSGSQGTTVYSTGFPVLGNTDSWTSSSDIQVANDASTAKTRGTGYALNLFEYEAGDQPECVASRALSGLTVGKQYTFTAWGIEWNNTEAGSIWLGVSGIGSGSTVATHGNTSSTWVQATYSFVATSTSHTLQMHAKGQAGAGHTDILWDDISLDSTTSDTQSAYQLIIQPADGSSTLYDTGKVVSSGETATIPADTLENGTDYRWGMYVWNSFDLISPLSNWDTFTTAADVEVTITAPVSGVVLDVDNVVVTWTVSAIGGDTQAKRRVRAIKVSDESVLVDTGMGVTTSQTYTVTGMDSDSQYRIEVSVESTAVVTSEVAEVTVFTEYSNPMKPTAAITATGSSVTLVIINPAPAGMRPATTSNEIYRAAVSGSTVGDYVLIGTTTPDGTFTDDLVGANSTYNYKIRAVAA